MQHRHNDEFVCDRCINDIGIASFIEEHAESKACSFCGRRSSRPIAAPLHDVIEYMESCVNGPYEDPANSMAYESAEGGYQGETYSTEELLTEVIDLEFPNDQDGKLLYAISYGFETEIWCEADPYGMSPHEQLSFSWADFCKTIKHERRYFFLKNGSIDRELLDPAQVLDAIFGFAQNVGLFVPLARGSKLFRVRHQPAGKSYTTATDLGPPPVEMAVQTNRMSPPGIVMMYASEDAKTALAETANEPGAYMVGTFTTDRDALILDLSALPRVPSIFEEVPDTLECDPRVALIFLREIAHDISRPIARDEYAHIEYVPTQVVTEYLRTVTTIDGRKIDGIRYKSSREHVATSLVLFADQDSLLLPEAERPQFYREEDRWIRLLSAKKRRVKKEQLSKWNPKAKK